MQSSLFLSLLLLLLCTSALAVPVVTKPEADKVEPHDEETSKDIVVEPVVEHDEDVEEEDAKDATGMKIDDEEEDEEELHEGEGDIVMKDGGSVDTEEKEAEKETEGGEEVDQDAVDADDDDDVIETTEVPISTSTTGSEDSDGASEVSSILKEAESTSKLVDGASTEASTELPSSSSSSTPSTDEEESTTVEPEEHFNETSTTEAPTTTTSSESKKEGEEEIVATSTVEVVHKQTQFTEADLGAAKLLEVVAEKLKAEPNGEEPDKIVISEQKLHNSIAKIIESVNGLLKLQSEVQTEVLVTSAAAVEEKLPEVSEIGTTTVAVTEQVSHDEPADEEVLEVIEVSEEGQEEEKKKKDESLGDDDVITTTTTVVVETTGERQQTTEAVEQIDGKDETPEVVVVDVDSNVAEVTDDGDGDNDTDDDDGGESELEIVPLPPSVETVIDDSE